MTDEEKWEIWRNKNAEIKKPYGESVHKHIVWYEGVDRRKAFLDGLAEGRKEKWHDLRKNPDDLPKKDGTYLVSILLSNQIVTDTHEYRDGYFSKYLRIIAWCELPKFEE